MDFGGVNVFTENTFGVAQKTQVTSAASFRPATLLILIVFDEKVRIFGSTTDWTSALIFQINVLSGYQQTKQLELAW